jgi:hypothetical protein
MEAVSEFLRCLRHYYYYYLILVIYNIFRNDLQINLHTNF